MQELEFDEKNHVYKLAGVVIPSVTQVISSAGLSDFSRVDPDLLLRSQKFGTAVHLACAFHDRGQLDMESLDPALLPYLESWQKFKRMFNITEFAEIEKQVYSKIYGYAGCLDRLWEDILIEIKTSTTIPKTTGLQLAGYQQAYQETTKVKIKRRLCVQLLEGTYKIQLFEEKSDFRVFTSCLNIRNWRKINNQKEK